MKHTKRTYTDDLLRLARASLESWGVDFTEADGKVTLSMESLVQIISDLHEQHGYIHLIREKLETVFPVIGLHQSIESVETDFHEQHPSNDAFDALAEEIRQRERYKAAQEQRDAVARVLGIQLSPPPMPPDSN